MQIDLVCQIENLEFKFFRILLVTGQRLNLEKHEKKKPKITQIKFTTNLGQLKAALQVFKLAF